MARASLRLSPRGLGVLAMGCLTLAVGLVTSYPGAVALGASLLALLVLSCVSVLVPVPLTVARTVEPAVVPRLADCSAVVRLRNGSTRLPLDLSGTDHVAGRDLPLGVARLGPGETTEIRISVPTGRRGTFRLGPLTLVRRGFAGLAVSPQAHGRSATVTVVPRVLDVAVPPPGVRRGHVGADERVEHGGTDLVGIREYVPGDDLRRLHWATSARAGTLMVRQDADPSEPHLTVLLDDRATAHEGDGFEEAVDLAVSLVAGAVSAGSPVHLMTWSGAVDDDVPAAVPGDPGPLRALQQLVLAAADVEPTPAGAGGPAGATPWAEPVPLLGHRPDVLVVVTGTGTNTGTGTGTDTGPRSGGEGLDEILLHTAAAPHGFVMVVDRSPEQVVSAAGATTVLRGPRADDVAAAWARAVAR